MLLTDGRSNQPVTTVRKASTGGIMTSQLQGDRRRSTLFFDECYSNVWDAKTLEVTENDYCEVFESYVPNNDDKKLIIANVCPVIFEKHKLKNKRGINPIMTSTPVHTPQITKCNRKVSTQSKKPKVARKPSWFNFKTNKLDSDRQRMISTDDEMLDDDEPIYCEI